MSKNPRPENTVRFALLGLLYNQPSHGYDLYQRFTNPDALGHVWHLGMSQMYADLKALEAKGWVRAKVAQQDPRPTKKIFSLTKTGQAAFQEWMEKPAKGLREMRIEFFVRLYFAQGESAKAIKLLVTRQEKSLREEMDRLLHDQSSPNDSGGFVETIHSFRIHQIKAALAWLKTISKAAVR